MTEPPDLSPPPDDRPRGLIPLLRDPTTLTVVLATALMLIVFYHRGSFAWLPPRLQMARLGWFGLNFVCLFVIPALFAALVLRRPLRDLGLRVGDWRLSLRFAALYSSVQRSPPTLKSCRPPRRRCPPSLAHSISLPIPARTRSR